ncbi:hypothetical protein QTI66_31315 [Variovorax sp. J22R133]|uniref:hypothetical protein n=1 Tax=Variovorax brevis TaxID=3053503 RepID=UPI002577F63E|nr:hypothetical protein [Variovorax sp. J22R133]MDM0116632.1 hypothetical protein [Variovorax sp. J22R133]
MIQLLGAFTLGALVSGVVAFGLNGPSPANASATRKLATAATAVPFDHGQSRLEVLRNEAAIGDDSSNQEITTALLDRYELTADPDDLYEAILWIDRRWEASGSAGAAQRVAANYCEHPVLRWHWLCMPGE